VPPSFDLSGGHTARCWLYADDTEARERRADNARVVHSRSGSEAAPAGSDRPAGPGPGSGPDTGSGSSSAPPSDSAVPTSEGADAP
jgi:peptide/nickel transport system ATP-binding protein